MCLGIPGKVLRTFKEHDVLMGKVDFGGVSKAARLSSVRHALHAAVAAGRDDGLERRCVRRVLRVRPAPGSVPKASASTRAGAARRGGELTFFSKDVLSCHNELPK
jgi:hypothetical protein